MFRTGLGSPTTTSLTMVLFMVVTFTMTELSHAQQTSDLRERATHDGFTGLLNRSEFLRRAEGAAGAVVVADLDNFKGLNDIYGHAAGDRALADFAAACRFAVNGDGLIGRLGGDEFGLLLSDAERAEEVAHAITARFLEGGQGQPTPTVSFGIAEVDGSIPVKDTIVRADVALYQAKAAGRDRVFRYG